MSKLIDCLLEDPITFPRVFAEMTGTAAAGIFLSRLLYWHRRSDPEKDHWFEKTMDSWKQETCMSRREIESARKCLVQSLVLSEKRDGVPPRMFYKLNIRELEVQLNVHADLVSAPVEWWQKPESNEIELIEFGNESADLALVNAIGVRTSAMYFMDHHLSPSAILVHDENPIGPIGVVQFNQLRQAKKIVPDQPALIKTGHRTKKTKRFKLLLNSVPEGPKLAMYKLCFGYDSPAKLKLLDKRQQSQVALNLEKLRQAGMDLNMIEDFQTWWSNDWRSRNSESKTYQFPRPDQVLQFWGQFLATVKLNNPEKPRSEGPGVLANIMEAKLQDRGN